MENLDQINFNCPFCNAAVESEYNSTINVTQNPELKKDLFTGKIFLRECPECKKDVQIIYDFIYHDMEKKILLGFSNNTENFIKIISELMNSKDSADFNFKTFYADYKIRAIKDINDLFEKIYIFDDQLDDRAIELCKVFISREFAEDSKHKEHKMIGLKYLPAEIFQKEYSGSSENLIGFNALTEDRKSLIIPIKKELYQLCVDHILNEIKSSEIEDNLVIDRQWLEINLN